MQQTIAAVWCLLTIAGVVAELNRRSLFPPSANLSRRPIDRRMLNLCCIHWRIRSLCRIGKLPLMSDDVRHGRKSLHPMSSRSAAQVAAADDCFRARIDRIGDAQASGHRRGWNGAGEGEHYRGQSPQNCTRPVRHHNCTRPVRAQNGAEPVRCLHPCETHCPLIHIHLPDSCGGEQNMSERFRLSHPHAWPCCD